MSLDNGLKLIIKVLKKTLDKNKMTGENSILYTYLFIFINLVDILSLTSGENGELTQTTIAAKDIDEILKVLKVEDKEEADKKK